MRKNFVAPLILLALLWALPAAAALVGTDDQQVKAVAEPILDNLLGGLNKGNYAQYSKDFDDALREALPEKKFLQVRQDIIERWGKYQSKNYLGFLNQQNYTVMLWKGTFDGTKNDVLIRLVLAKRQDKVVVAGLWFQ